MVLLEAMGFQVFALWRSLLRPKLVSPDRTGMPLNADPNYLATRDPDRAMARLEPLGWKVLTTLTRSRKLA